MLCVIKSQLVTTSEPWPVTTASNVYQSSSREPCNSTKFALTCLWSYSLISVSVVKVPRNHKNGPLRIAQSFAQGCLVEAGTSFNQIIVRSSPAELGRGETDAPRVCIEDMETKDPNNARPSPNFDAHSSL